MHVAVLDADLGAHPLQRVDVEAGARSLARQVGGQARKRRVLGPADADLARQTPASLKAHAVHPDPFIAGGGPPKRAPPAPTRPKSTRSMPAASFRHSREMNAPVCCDRRRT